MRIWTLLLLAPLLTTPAATRAEPVVESLHGEEIRDDFRWLEALESESEEVREWTSLQNATTRKVLESRPFRGDLEKRLASLLRYDAFGLPRMRATRYFYSHRRGDQNQAALYVREGPRGEPRLLLDPNALDSALPAPDAPASKAAVADAKSAGAAAQDLYTLSWYRPSPNGDLVAFGLSHAGDEMPVLHVLRTATGRWLADEIAGKVSFGSWAPDGTGFLYRVLDDPSNAYSRHVRYHELGTHPRGDKTLVRQRHPSEIPGAQLSDDGHWIISSTHKGWSEQDLYVADADLWRRTGRFEPVAIAKDLGARFEAMAVDGNTLYMLSTWTTPNGQLWAVDLTRPERDAWRVVIPERKDAVLSDVNLARGILLATYLQDASSRFERFRLDGTPIGPLELPGLGTASAQTHHDRTEAFVRFASFTEPPTIYRTDLVTGELELWERPRIPISPDRFVVNQVHCNSKDGTRIPLFIVHEKSLQLDGRNPCLLYGYGGFNISIIPRFRAAIFPWLENGGVYVTANLRGGGEYGEAWHRAGMLEKKQNVFDDFYAAAEFLIAQKYTRAEQLACAGRSNGGLLTGVAITQRPDLFAAAISGVPLLDMLRYHRFLMARFWIPEYGSPDESESFSWLRAYSPYHNIRPQTRYPAVLFTAGENDNRVHPMHARKMAAALQAAATNDPLEDPILLWVDRAAGHGAGKPLEARIRAEADEWSFLMWQTGLRLKATGEPR